MLSYIRITIIIWEIKKRLDNLNNEGVLNLRKRIEYVENSSKFKRMKYYFAEFGDNLVKLPMSDE